FQEESGEIECSESNGVPVWVCPLCQQGQTNRDALAVHLTQRHSVLPACLDRLLDTAAPVDCASEDNVEADSQSDIDPPSSQLTHLGKAKTISGPLETDLSTGPKQAAGNNQLQVVSSKEKDNDGEGERVQQEAEGTLESTEESTQISNSVKYKKESSKITVDNEKSISRNSAIAPGDPALEKFLDPNRPFKCTACLESFPSKSVLSVHYSSSTHQQRMKAALSKQGGENDSSSSIQPNQSHPFTSSKPYQCAVCRVSYNHAITLESHLKSVLHQSRSRNAGNSASSTTGNSGSKSSGNSGNGTTTTNCSDQGNLAAPLLTTKDGEQTQPHPVLSPLSSPVASAQAVSAFLTLLTSSPHSLSPSVLPSLFTVNTSASPAAPAPQLIPQQQLLLPLFLNGLQAQAQNPNSESASPVLTQPVSVLGVSAAQQALLAQRLSSLQSLSLAVGNSAAIHTSEEENEKGENAGEKEIVEEQRSTLQSEKKNGEEESLKDNNKDGERSTTKGCEHEEHTETKLSGDEETEVKKETEEFCGEIVQPNLFNSPASYKIPDESPSPCNVSVPSNTSLSPIHLNLTLSPDTTPQKSHTDISLSPSSSPNHKLSLNSISTEKKSVTQPSLLSDNLAQNVQDPACPSAKVKPPSPKHSPPVLSEFQSQVLWAFLESRSETDAASPLQEDCEALSLEVGLEMDEVRRWLWDARETREKDKFKANEHASCKLGSNDQEYKGTEKGEDMELEEEEGVLTIVESEGAESPAKNSHVMDLSNSGERQKEQGREIQGSDLDKEEFYTAGGLIVVRVKPESALAIPTSTNSATVSINSNNNAKSNAAYIKPAERVSNSVTERQRDKEREREKEHKNPKARRYRDMRRSRTIIQTEQLDVLYGCYFKDPNPGKHEFEQISEWVHLPKKVVQIWFQNMRARERKGEVRFISDGTLAAVGKPLIKFTWPLQKPIFSSSPKPNTSTVSSSGVTKVPPAASPVLIHPKTRQEQQKEKDKEALRPKLETQNPAATAKVMPKANAVTAALPEVVMEVRSTRPYSSQNHKGDKEEITDDEEEEPMMEKIGPGTTNRMIPKQSTSACNTPALGSQKHNGLNYWSPKGPFKINTLSREQLGLSTVRASVAAAPVAAPATSTPPSGTIKSTHVEGAFLHHSTPRRPRTHLTSLQLSILQSCYETCAHPNALECETVGTELGLPLKVVQIWFQNTRAKEKRWRLQQEKQFPGSTDSKKVEFHAGSYLQYSALRANRPILPKPVQLTVLEPATPPAQGQSAGRETLRGRCEACGIGFESRAAARAHVFSPRHLATLRATNFGQPPSLVNNCTGSTSGSGVAALSSSPSPAISTS
ncbi:hypothetical protein JZ751_003870, partial [Albula glossodonta]